MEQKFLIDSFGLIVLAFGVTSCAILSISMAIALIQSKYDKPHKEPKK